MRHAGWMHWQNARDRLSGPQQDAAKRLLGDLKRRLEAGNVAVGADRMRLPDGTVIEAAWHGVVPKVRVHPPSGAPIVREPPPKRFKTRLLVSGTDANGNGEVIHVDAAEFAVIGGRAIEMRSINRIVARYPVTKGFAYPQHDLDFLDPARPIPVSTFYLVGSNIPGSNAARITKHRLGDGEELARRDWPNDDYAISRLLYNPKHHLLYVTMLFGQLYILDPDTLETKSVIYEMGSNTFDEITLHPSGDAVYGIFDDSFGALLPQARHPLTLAVEHEFIQRTVFESTPVPTAKGDYLYIPQGHSTDTAENQEPIAYRIDRDADGAFSYISEGAVNGVAHTDAVSRARKRFIINDNAVFGYSVYLMMYSDAGTDIPVESEFQYFAAAGKPGISLSPDGRRFYWVGVKSKAGAVDDGISKLVSYALEDGRKLEELVLGPFHPYAIAGMAIPLP